MALNYTATIHKMLADIQKELSEVQWYMNHEYDSTFPEYQKLKADVAVLQSALERIQAVKADYSLAVGEI